MLKIVILAAGASSRLGTNKQLLKINGEPLVSRITKVASELVDVFNLEQPCVIIGKDHREVELALADLSVSTIHNKLWNNGMGSSIAVAVENLDATVSAVLLMTCDQVLLTVTSLKPMLRQWLCNPDYIIASCYDGIAGIPVIFPEHFFPELTQLNSDKGARQLLEKYQHQVQLFDLPEAAVDLDNRVDEQLIRQMLE